MKFSRRQLMRVATAGALTTAVAEPARSHLSTLRLPVEAECPSLKRATGWLNSPPLDLASLRGRVVLINFWTYTCINSLRTLPYLRAWADKYRQQGLVVIGVHTPEFVFEHDLDNVRMAVRASNVEYPIAVDSGYSIWRAFSNEYWPAFYFVDANGHIRHHQFGEGGYDRSESVIQKLLRDAGRSDVSSNFATVDARGIEAAPDWANLQSPETYLGIDLTQNFSGLSKGHYRVFPPQLKFNHWALEGDWTIGKQAAVLKEGPGRIAYRFHARDLHLVMAPPDAGKSVRFRISLDGMPPGPAHGIDVDSQGHGILSEPRLYQLIRQPPPVRDRELAIEFLDGAVQAVDFTFG